MLHLYYNSMNKWNSFTNSGIYIVLDKSVTAMWWEKKKGICKQHSFLKQGRALAEFRSEHQTRVVGRTKGMLKQMENQKEYLGCKVKIWD